MKLYKECVYALYTGPICGTVQKALANKVNERHWKNPKSEWNCCWHVVEALYLFTGDRWKWPRPSDWRRVSAISFKNKQASLMHRSPLTELWPLLNKLLMAPLRFQAQMRSQLGLGERDDWHRQRRQLTRPVETANKGWEATNPTGGDN